MVWQLLLCLWLLCLCLWLYLWLYLYLWQLFSQVLLLLLLLRHLVAFVARLLVLLAFVARHQPWLVLARARLRGLEQYRYLNSLP